ncbi:hypothetical protein TNCV_3506181 [Trichonephila clavipes]|uniref:Uncharacterized protein n=1 Tax=Trichonephila clavipes TaxID=2585209 RepID=A0A8X6VCD4_TRICX|nr:hypothetical protein TNCV_3506181 [Trichonephila clavipes]
MSSVSFLPLTHLGARERDASLSQGVLWKFDVSARISSSSFDRGPKLSPVALRDDNRQHGDENQHSTWNHKYRLVGKNIDNSSRWEDDEPDEGCGQANVGIWSAVLRLKKPGRICKFFTSHGVATGSSGHCAAECVVHKRWFNRTFFDSGAQLPPCYISREVNWTGWTCYFASTFPRRQSLEFLLLRLLEIACV